MRRIQTYLVLELWQWMVALPRQRCRLSDATRIRQIGGDGAEIELSKGVVHHWRTPLRHRLSRNHIATRSSGSYSPPQLQNL